MSDTTLEHTQAIAELLGLNIDAGQGDPVVAMLSSIRAYLTAGGGGGGSGGGQELASLDARKLEKKTTYANGSWDWWRSDKDGGGHYRWDADSGILQFSGFVNNDGPIVFENSAILGGGPNFNLSGGTRVGTRLIAAWDGGGKNVGTIRTYYTVGKTNNAFSASDEITTQQWAQTFLTTEQGVPRGTVPNNAALALIADPKRGDWVLEQETDSLYAYNGLTWTWLFGFPGGSSGYVKPPGGIPSSDLALAVRTSLGKADTALQSFTEEDPTVPEWAKAEEKPTYTASEVGAYVKPEDGIPATDLDEDVQESLDKADTALQSFTEEDPTVPTWAKAESRPEYTAADVGLGNVDNTSDADKPVSTAQAAAIAAAQLNTQKWTAAVETKALLPEPGSLSRTATWLCRVMKDPDTANNGVWQLIPDAEDWTFFSDNLDFVDENELAEALGNVVPKTADPAVLYGNDAAGAPTTYSSKRILPSVLDPVPAPVDTNVLWVYLDSVNGDDGNDGLLAASPKQTLLALLTWLKTVPKLNIDRVYIQMTNSGSYELPIGYVWRFPFDIIIAGSESYGVAAVSSTVTLTGSGAQGIIVYSKTEFNSVKFVSNLTASFNFIHVRHEASIVSFYRVEFVNTNTTRYGAAVYLNDGARAVFGKCGATNLSYFSWLDRADANAILNNETGDGQILTDVETLFGMSVSSVKVTGNSTNQTYTTELSKYSSGAYIKNGELISSRRLLGDGYISSPRPSAEYNYITFHVDGTTGSDANNGLTSSAAVATVEKAIDLVRSLTVSKMTRNIIRILDAGDYTLPTGFKAGTVASLQIVGTAYGADDANPANYATLHISSASGAANALSFPSESFIEFTNLKIKASLGVDNSRAIFMGSGRMDRVLLDTENGSLPTAANTVGIQCDNGIVAIANLSVRNFHFAFRATGSVVNIRQTGYSANTRMECPTLFQVSGATINSVAFLPAYSSYTNVSQFDSQGIINYGENVTLSDNKWVAVPIQWVAGADSTGNSLMRYNKQMKQYWLHLEGVRLSDSIDWAPGDTLLDAALGQYFIAPPTTTRNGVLAQCAIDLVSGGGVGRLPCVVQFVSLDGVAGQIKLFPIVPDVYSAPIPAIKGGRLYGDMLFNVDMLG